MCLGSVCCHLHHSGPQGLQVDLARQGFPGFSPMDIVRPASLNDTEVGYQNVKTQGPDTAEPIQVLMTQELQIFTLISMSKSLGMWYIKLISRCRLFTEFLLCLSTKQGSWPGGGGGWTRTKNYDNRELPEVPATRRGM